MAIDCSCNQAVGLQPATPQKIAECLASMRSDLLKMIIPKWEQSRQGVGGQDNKEEEQESNHNNNEEQQDEREDDSNSRSIILLASNNSRQPSSIGSVSSPMCSLSH
jgi:hypothetical protein